ncbi:MAG: GNAT family N-acetyltransferase [Hyphomonadaceae bacterium]|nr:GNAT family N-acetyltransferase [Hyphomonadaceae bacterium]
MADARMSVRALRAEDAGWVTALNAANVAATAPMDEAAYRNMLEQAFRATALEGACLIAFDEGADYGSENFEWFGARYERFAYVDRVIVPEAARGKGLARALYEDLFAASRGAGKPLVCCEINTPNPVSDVFHARMGFGEVGKATLRSGKRVRYLARTL